ncbi:MAG: hypothetical protein LCH38_00470 [Proteobacteria bacterium]|nr:hypothetical protein [Pseudomonadota bacterium]
MSVTIRLRSTALALAGGTCLLAILVAPGSAQFYPRPYFGVYPDADEIIIPRRPAGLPIRAIFAELEERGYRPQSVVARRGDVVIINALDPRRQPVRLVVDAFDAEILERFARDVATSVPPPGTPGLPPQAGNPAPRKIETERAKREAEKFAEVPPPPRRAAEPSEAPRTAPVAPARPSSEWLPPDLAQPKP